MTLSPSGTLGHLQLLSFTHDASSDAIRQAADALKLTQVEVRDGTVVDAAVYLSQHASPAVLMVEVTSVDHASAQLDALADVLHPSTKVIVCGTIDSMRFYQWLMEIGIHEYLLAPFTESALAQAIVTPIASEASVDKPTENTPKLVALIGARGGVGTSSIAVNLAWLLASTHQRKTALFDLDPYFGSVALNLDIEPSRGLRDALEKPDRVDALFLERVMLKPHPNLSVLSSEEALHETIATQPQAGEAMLQALRSKFEMILVDLPRQMTPLTRTVLAQADLVLNVAEPQLSSLRDALRLKDYLVETLKRPAPKLLLNRIGMNSKHELSLKEFTKHYGAAPDVEVPYASEWVAATADGTLLADKPKPPAAFVPLAAFAASVNGDDEGTAVPAAAGKSLLMRWGRKGRNA